MKTSQSIRSLACLASAVCSLHAGEPHDSSPNPSVGTDIATPSREWWIKPTLDIRARFEYGDVAMPGLSDATAFTLRERVGLKTKSFHGFQAVVEGEFLQAPHDRFDSAPTPFATQTTDPNPSTPRTQINDPENEELNQAYLQYEQFHTVLRGGRQRIILDNAAFVGNVGWRQNEQTFDAVSLTNTTLDELSLFYAYVNRANRIFGADATGALRSFAGDIHLLNAHYRGLGDLTLTGYAYLMDFDKTAANAGYISNNTFGLAASHPAGPLTLVGELAHQTDTSSSPAIKPDHAWYAHLKVSGSVKNHTLTLGWEYLDADFVTPLATVHAFNGFADAFIAPRLGLVRNPGLSDLYLRHDTPLPVLGLKFSHAVHLFGDNQSTLDNYGLEYDAVLSKKFDDHFTAIAKFAWFDSAGPSGIATAPNPAPFDTTRISIELNYKY